VVGYGFLARWGRPWSPTWFMRHLRTLSAVAAGRTLGVSRGSLPGSAHWALSIALVGSQDFVYRTSANLLARVSGRAVLEATMFLSWISVNDGRCMCRPAVHGAHVYDCVCLCVCCVVL
jgi:hypothetical protein